MKLETKELQELYDELVSAPLTFSVCEESPVERAFTRCDALLQEHVRYDYLKKLQDEKTEQEKRADILKSQRDEALVDNLRLNKELDELQSRAHRAEDEVEELKKDKKRIHQSRIEWAEIAVEKNKKLTEAEEKIQKLKEDRDRYSELDGIRKDYDELMSQYQKLTIENKRLQDSIRKIGYEQGQTDLWDMLQNVNDSQPFELVTCFPDVTGMEDILNWDLEDFLDAYKKWQEEKEKKRLVSYDIPIKDLASWECTIEATVEINKDLLEKVCGVKPKEEHKLKYGDAVRVLCRDYDYMYIGPENEHISLFNPKTHNVIPVSPTEKLTYQGYKIIIGNEDDLRKIWNRKK